MKYIVRFLVKFVFFPSSKAAAICIILMKQNFIFSIFNIRSMKNYILINIPIMKIEIIGM